MLILSVKKRVIVGKEVKALREQGLIPAVLYGPKTENEVLSVDLKEFEKIYQEAGMSSIICLKIKQAGSDIKEVLVLVKDISFHPLTEKPLHIDFFKPKMDEKVEAAVPLVFEGVAPAVKELGGTLIKNISEINVSALPQKLPVEIKVNIESLKAHGDYIKAQDLKAPEGVEFLIPASEVVVSVIQPRKTERDVAKPETVEEVKEQEKEAVEKTVEENE